MQLRVDNFGAIMLNFYHNGTLDAKICFIAERVTVEKRKEIGDMNGIDSAVGQRIRQRRKLLGLSQTELAVRVGVKFQQVQKYETGVNRVAASRLWKIAETLRVPITYFFEDLEVPGFADKAGESNDPSLPETSEMIKIFNRLPPAQKLAMSSFLQSLDNINEPEHN
nr:helix-turn-helix transcriptional regulator [uncultured Roseovarius sp.]